MKLPFAVRPASCIAIVLLNWAAIAPSSAKSADADTADAEHELIGVKASKTSVHTQHPDAQWYPEAGLGLFIHWGISSVKDMYISWPMIQGGALAKKRIADPAERERIIREEDWNLKGDKPEITPNQYWDMAKEFNPQKYDPDKWCKAAKEAGFTYAVLTAKHHDGFALWPSAYGDYNTSNFMGGRDLVKEYVEACRRNGIKVGLYFSGPDWHFDRDYMSFLYSGARKMNPEFPTLDTNLKPYISKKSQEEIDKHQAEFSALVNGQIEELLTRYGKIDLIWFDGRPTAGDNKPITQERIRELQPGILISPRLHGSGDFFTYERKLTIKKPVKGWAEFCNPWTSCWSHKDLPFRAPFSVLGDLVLSRSVGVNYLLGVGPMGDGQFCDGIYQNLDAISGWMKLNRTAVTTAKPLASAERASVPATASELTRYLFVVPQSKGRFPKDLLPPTDVTVTLSGVAKPTRVILTSDGSALKYSYADSTITIQLPAAKRSQLVDVVQIDLSATAPHK